MRQPASYILGALKCSETDLKEGVENENKID